MDANQDRNEPHQSPQPRKRRWRWILGFVAVPMILFIAVAGYVLLSPSQFQQEMAALRAEGLPTNAKELNAYYSVPSGVTDTTELWTAATAAIRNARKDHRTKMIPIGGMGPPPIPPPGTEWPQLDASRIFLQELEPEMQIIRRAAEAGGMARYPIDFNSGRNTLLPDIHEARSLARLLKLSAHVRTHDRQNAEAMKDVFAIFPVSESLRGEPCIISQLVRIAIHAMGCELINEMLPHNEWTNQELEQLQSVINTARFREEFIRAERGEAVMNWRAMDSSVPIFFRDANKLKSFELFREAIDALNSSWRHALQNSDTIKSQLSQKKTDYLKQMHSVWAQQLFPAIEQALNAGARAEARQNCLIATIAAYRYRLQHGKLPVLLGDLKDFIAGDDATKTQRLTDPFDGQPLRFKSNSGNVVIYSISENRRDDSGVISNDKPQEGDLGYSIPL